MFKRPPRMNAPPPPTVSEEDITEAAPFFNIIKEDDAVMTLTLTKLNYFSVVMLLIFRDTVSYVCFFIIDTVILHPRITHLLSSFCHFL